MKNKKWIYDFVPVGNKVYQFKNEKLIWITKF